MAFFFFFEFTGIQFGFYLIYELLNWKYMYRIISLLIVYAIQLGEVVMSLFLIENSGHESVVMYLI